MATLTTHDALLKEVYSKKEVEKVVIKNNPLLAMLEKKNAFRENGGRLYVVPVIYGVGQGTSATFADAQSNSDSSTASVAFNVTRVKQYQVANIDRELMKATEGNANAFIDATKDMIEGALYNLGRDLELALFRSGWGSRGTVGSSSGSTITLATADDAHNFEIGQVVQFSASESAAVLRDSGDSLTISGINYDDGILTFSAAVSGISGLSNGDHIFLKGDRENSATPTRKKVAGLEAWVPYTRPSASESFFGVDRSVSDRLSGVRVDATGLSVSDALLKLGHKLARVGSAPDIAMVSFDTWAKLSAEMMGKGQVDVQAVGDLGIGFRAIEVAAGQSLVKVLPSHGCPNNRLFMLDSSKWELATLGDTIEIHDEGGSRLMQKASSDSYELRASTIGNLVCRAPGFNGVAKL